MACLTCFFGARRGFAETSAARQTTLAATPGNEEADRNSILRFLAVDHDGYPVMRLQIAELSLRVNREPRKIFTLIPTDDEPRMFGIFFDTSGSSRFDKVFGTEVQAAGEFLESIWHPDDSGFVVAFADSPYALAKPTIDLTQIQVALKSIPMEPSHGATALYDSLCSIRFGSQIREREKLFVVVSDFEDDASHVSLDKTIQTMQQEGVRIAVILRALGGDHRQDKAVRIKERAREVAEHTGGDVFVATNKVELDAAFHRLAGELRGAYRLTYEPLPSGPNPGKQELRTSRGGVELLYTKN